jgi:hypothetical protein
MTNIAAALADVLAADRNLARLERCGWAIPEDMQAARNTLEAMSEELIHAMDEHISKTIIRAVASMPGHTTEV